MFDVALIGAGVYSDEIAALVGDNSFSVNVRRGEYMLLDKECGDVVIEKVAGCDADVIETANKN